MYTEFKSFNVLLVIQRTGRVHVACDVNCFIETGGFFKVTGIYVHCKTGNISQTLRDRDVVTTDHE